MGKSHETHATELATALRLLVRRMRAQVPSESRALSSSQMAVLKRLDADGPATTAELARREGIKPQSMGATVAALEEMGLVGRKPHPTDGRQTHIVQTAAGAAMRKSARDAKETWLAHAIAQLDATERKNLPAVIGVITHLASS